MNGTIHARPPSLPRASKSVAQKRKPKILVFPPHADDEIFLAGGLAVRAKKEIPGIEIVAALMTAGFVPELEKKRIKEFISACEVLGMVPKRFNFPLTKKGLVSDVGSNKPRVVTFLDPKDDRFIHTVAGAIQKEAPTAIIMPHEEDWHPDHLATASIVKAALLKLSNAGVNLDLLLFLARVWQDLPSPNLLVALDKATHLKKQEALRIHASQLTSGAKPGEERVTHNRYDLMLSGIDQLNAIMGPEKIKGPSSKDPGIEFAELYSVSRIAGGIGGKLDSKIILLYPPLTEGLFVAE